MSKINSKRSGCVDVFHASLLSEAQYAGKYEFPVIKPEHQIPRKMIPFTKALKVKNDFHQWVCFYEDDYLFERVWNQPNRYVEILKRFDGVITPDFSVYYDMPYSMQIWNVFRSRTLGAWFQQKGIKVIPNIRFGDRRTFDYCCDGISKHSIISIGSLGCLKVKEYRPTFEAGVKHIVNRLQPEAVVIYGAAPAIVSDIMKHGSDVVIIEPESFHIKKEVKR